ncbi:MAG TPA: sugar phosphate isomerase/epimerase family protein [Bacteroidota bacterium]|nr:sugar phosphate isomerase/epimerase family protein [Bacteroidota bacterium]
MTTMETLALGIVTDEISSDIEVALHQAAQWNISLFELRVVGTGRVPFIAEEDAVKIDCAIRNDGITITALSPGIFKHPLTQADAIEHELADTLPKTIEMARRFGARVIIVFGFQRLPQDDESLRRLAVGYMARAADLAAASDIVIAIENEPGFWCDTGAHTAALLKKINSPHLCANWDPANALGTDEVPFPNGYKALKPYIANVHVKDTIEGSLLRCVPVGEGKIPWKDHVKALLEDQIVSHITIETHCLPLVEQSEKNIRTLRTYMEELHQSL